MIADPVVVEDWHAIARSEDVQENKITPARLLCEDLILWRCGGEVKAWQDLCIHRGTRLSLGRIENHAVVCAYHGWSYNGDGKCVRIPAHPNQQPPAKAKVRTYRAKEQYGLVWVSLGNPQKDLPSFHEWNDPTFRKILVGPYKYKSSAPRAIENFLDIAHFPFVHAGILGDPNRAEVADYEPVVDADGITASDVRIWQPDPDGRGHGEIRSLLYRVSRPLTASLTSESQGQRYMIWMTVAPVTQVESLVWFYIAINYMQDVPDEELAKRIKEYEHSIVSADIPVVESQRPELLPLDLQAELHLRSDRTSITYRKWLRQMGLSFGTD